jgi:hypothetical protein
VKLLATLTYNKQLPRSFVSKYLHFHRAIVPIYDRVAADTLNALLPWKKAYDCTPLDEAEDKDFRQYVMQLRQLNRAAERAGFAPKMMELDWYLLCEADRPTDPPQ